MGVSIGPRMEICETSGLPIPMVLCFQKCNALVGEEIVLTSAEPQTTPFYGSQYSTKNGPKQLVILKGSYVYEELKNIMV